MERKFEGCLNSKNHFGDQETRRFDKYVKLNKKTVYNPLRMNWFKQKFDRYTSNKPVMIDNSNGKTYVGQRSWNANRATKSRYIVLMPWRL